MNGNHTMRTILLTKLIMNPDDIKLESMGKSFEYEKVAREIDSIEDVKMLRKVAKSYVKLFLKQKETITSIAKMKIDD
jgi:hypothetical protein